MNLNFTTMYYVIIQRADPQNRTAPKRYYYQSRIIGKKTLKDVGRHIEKRTSLTLGDVMNVLENSVDIIVGMVKDGYSVSMGDLGTFRGTFRSHGELNVEDLTPNAIYNPRIVFLASADMKSLLYDVHYRQLPTE